MAKPVRQFITAGSAGEEVPAQSTFAPMFIDAINGDADLNRDGYVTGSEVGMHLSQNLPTYKRQHPQYGKIDDYKLSRGDFIFFAGSSATTKSASSSMSHTVAAAAPVEQKRVEPDYFEPEMALIKSGSFMMGLGEDEWDEKVDG